MNKSLKSVLLSLCLLYGTTTKTYEQSDGYSTAKTFATVCLGIGAIIGGTIGLTKFINWAYYYTTDNTPTETFVIRLSYQMQTLTPYLEDFQLYLTGISLPLIINARYPNFEYPTLTYYSALKKISDDLYYLEEAFERKKSKNEETSQMYIFDEKIIQTNAIRERVNTFKKIVSESHAYSVEYKAKYPPAPQVNTVIVYHHHDTQY